MDFNASVQLHRYGLWGILCVFEVQQELVEEDKIFGEICVDRETIVCKQGSHAFLKIIFHTFSITFQY